MARMWKIYKVVGKQTAACISQAIDDRAEYLRFVDGMNSFMAHGKAATDIHKLAKRRYREGGTEAVREQFGPVEHE